MADLLHRRREAYDHLDRTSQIGLVGWSSFTATFAGVRLLTHAIRANRGPFRNLSLGGEHLHHYMWGILMVGTSGGLALAMQPTEDSTTTLSVLYGAGAALIKSGLLGKLWKFIAVGAMAVVAGVRRFFGGRGSEGTPS